MFIGHFAPAFVAAAAYSRGPKLGTYFVAAQLVDWAFFSLAILGVEKMRIDPGATVMVPFDLYFMPYTHSLAGTAVWALVFGIILAIGHRDKMAGLLAALVVIFYMSKSRGPKAQPIILLMVLLAFQALNWFGPEPDEAGLLVYVQALVAFGIVTALAVWVGENRYFTQRGGLAAASL